MILLLWTPQPAGGGPPVSDWILATGFWEDTGFWRDGENWID